MSTSGGVVLTGSGMGWCCLICRRVDKTPLDYCANPALASVHGMSVCTHHLRYAVQVALPPNATPAQWVDDVVAVIAALKRRARQ